MPRKTVYHSEWKNDNDWLEECKSDTLKAHCKYCKTDFDISNGGISQVNRHAETKKHLAISETLSGATSQRTLFTGGGKLQISLGFSNADKVLRTEILWALNCVQKGYSFQSNDGNNLLFSEMFPDSAIAKDFKMAQTKCKYLVQFGLSEWFFEDLLDDIKDMPFSYAFDETTTVQVKKQYDGYIRYESKRHGAILDRYAGSLYLGHCDAIKLKDNFFEFGKTLNWNIQYLLQLETDNPNVNKSFKQKLKAELRERYNKTIADIGPCPLHTTQNGFAKGLKMLSCDLDGFACDLHFFFKHSSARREDFKLTELSTEIEVHWMLRHVSSRWLSIRKILERIAEQWENLREKPMVHVLYPAIGDMLFNLMSNFVKPKILRHGEVKMDAVDLNNIDLSNEKNLKGFHDLNIGTKAAYQIGLLESNTNLDVIKCEFKSAFIETAKYLQNKLPHRYPLIQHLQYLHPSKVMCEDAISSIRQVAISMGKILQGSGFFTGDIDRYVDMVVEQLNMLQTEDLHDICDLTSYEYWQRIAEMKDIHGNFKYLIICRLVKTCFSLSHGNAVPERGFSANKSILQDKESLQGETLVAIRAVKDGLDTYKGVLNVPMTDRLMSLCRSARQKYVAHLEAKKLETEKLHKKKQQDEKAEREHQEKKAKSNKIKEIDKSIMRELADLNVAEKLLTDSNKCLSKVVSSKGTVNKTELIKAQAVLTAAIKRINDLKRKIDDLKKQKSSLEKK